MQPCQSAFKAFKVSGLPLLTTAQADFSGAFPFSTSLVSRAPFESFALERLSG